MSVQQNVTITNVSYCEDARMQGCKDMVGNNKIRPVPNFRSEDENTIGFIMPYHQIPHWCRCICHLRSAFVTAAGVMLIQYSNPELPIPQTNEGRLGKTSIFDRSSIPVTYDIVSSVECSGLPAYLPARLSACPKHHVARKSIPIECATLCQSQLRSSLSSM
jgi:hypothetical protein